MPLVALDRATSLTRMFARSPEIETRRRSSINGLAGVTLMTTFADAGDAHRMSDAAATTIPAIIAAMADGARCASRALIERSPGTGSCSHFACSPQSKGPVFL